MPFLSCEATLHSLTDLQWENALVDWSRNMLITFTMRVESWAFGSLMGFSFLVSQVVIHASVRAAVLCVTQAQLCCKSSRTPPTASTRWQSARWPLSTLGRAHPKSRASCDHPVDTNGAVLHCTSAFPSHVSQRIRDYHRLSDFRSPATLCCGDVLVCPAPLRKLLDPPVGLAICEISVEFCEISACRRVTLLRK
jgi:hypothetical protein